MLATIRSLLSKSDVGVDFAVVFVGETKTQIITLFAADEIGIVFKFNGRDPRMSMVPWQQVDNLSTTVPDL